jgi:hypothetical protein
VSLSYIREYYGVPAEVGCRVVVDSHVGVIVGASDARLLVELADGRTIIAHPTWRVWYLGVAAEERNP